ncbi:MAG: nuclear transport factor 2 family protein [Chloroflexota bacterium]|jgi:hypothetical protein|nr:nuclear transport factor 2 family protein [Chloroflexota bacterium]MDH5242873.1 nuclear transport factor 2 family protein [Chloroflexota bacterium]
MKRAAAAILLAAFACAGMFASCSDSNERSSTTVPTEVSQLVDDWGAALERGDGSVLDLYTPDGYHLYGATRYTGDEMAAHLEFGLPEDHVWVTDPVLIVDQGDRFIVTGGLSNKAGGRWWTSAFTFEIVDTPDGLRVAQTNWLDAKLSRPTPPDIGAQGMASGSS